MTVGSLVTSFAKLESADEVLFGHRAEIALEEISPLGVFSRWRSDASALRVDDFDDSDSATNLLGGANASSGLDRSEDLAVWASTRGSTSTAGFTRFCSATPGAEAALERITPLCALADVRFAR